MPIMYTTFVLVPSIRIAKRDETPKKKKKSDAIKVRVCTYIHSIKAQSVIPSVYVHLGIRVAS